MAARGSGGDFGGVVNAYIYTAIAGDYPIQRSDIPCLQGEPIFTRPVLDAKRFKILPHLYCSEHAVTVYVDGNVWPLTDAQTLIDRYLGDGDLAVFVHPFRQTVWEEFAILRQHQRFKIPYLQQQLVGQEVAYRADGLPKDTPLYECNFLIRRNTERVNRLMDAWWAEICRWQWRDQVSLPYVLWRYGAGLKLRAIEGQDIRLHADFRYVRHYS